ncbi:MAG: hypothetical protein IBX47_13300, partial [Desulfuromonadales bacterium]|nr:hypothetical protein [Desulfuromonadales bacterium]
GPATERDKVGDGFYLWGAQLERSLTVSPYWSQADMPARRDWTRNHWNYSIDFTTSTWGKAHAAVTSAAVAGPDPQSGAVYKLNEDSQVGSSYIYRSNLAIVAGEQYTASFYLKAAQKSAAKILFFSTNGAFPAGATAIVNLLTGVVTPSAGIDAATAVDIGGGWWRFDATSRAIGSTMDGRFGIGPAVETNDETAGFYLWAASTRNFTKTKIAALQDWTSSGAVTLNLTCDDASPYGSNSGCAFMQFSNVSATGPWSDWEAYAATRSGWNLTAGDGKKTVYARFRDAAPQLSGVGNVSIDASRDDISFEATAPTGSVAINSGDIWTQSNIVTLDLVCDDSGLNSSGCYQMRFSNISAAGPWSSWEAYATTRSDYVLPADDQADVPVFVQFRDLALNATQLTISDTIHIDSTPPEVSYFAINADAIWTNSATVTLDNICDDSLTGGSGCDKMQFSYDGATWEGLENYAASRPGWQLTAGDGTKYVWARFIDLAQNATTVEIWDSIQLDATLPTGSVLINDGADETGTKIVTLTLNCADPDTDPTTASGCGTVEYSNDGSNWLPVTPDPVGVSPFYPEWPL